MGGSSVGKARIDCSTHCLEWFGPEGRPIEKWQRCGIGSQRGCCSRSNVRRSRPPLEGPTPDSRGQPLGGYSGYPASIGLRHRFGDSKPYHGNSHHENRNRHRQAENGPPGFHGAERKSKVDEENVFKRKTISLEERPFHSFRPTGSRRSRQSKTTPKLSRLSGPDRAAAAYQAREPSEAAA